MSRALIIVCAAAGCATTPYAKLPNQRAVRAHAEAVVWKAMFEGTPGERAQATRIAAEVADPVLDRGLGARLEDPDPVVRAIAAVSLAPQSEPAREVLTGALDGDSPEARRVAIDGVRRLPEWKARVAKLAGDADAAVRARALRELGKDADVALVDAALHDPDLGVRLAAIDARLQRDPSWRPDGANLDLYVALHVAMHRARRYNETAPAVEAARVAATSPQPSLRVAGVQAAGSLGDAALPLVRTALHDPDLDVRLAAARILARRGDHDGMMLLAATPSLDAAYDLAQLGDARGTERLLAAAQSSDAAERARAIALLAPLPSSLPTLQRALDDPDRAIALTAAGALLRKAFAGQTGA